MHPRLGPGWTEKSPDLPFLGVLVFPGLLNTKEIPWTWVKPGRFGSFSVLCFLALGGHCLQMLCLPAFGTHANTRNLPHFRAFPASIWEHSLPKCLVFKANAKLPNRPGCALLQEIPWCFECFQLFFSVSLGLLLGSRGVNNPWCFGWFSWVSLPKHKGMEDQGAVCTAGRTSRATSEKFRGFWSKLLREVRGKLLKIPPPKPPKNFSKGPLQDRPAVATFFFLVWFLQISANFPQNLRKLSPKTPSLTTP